jgi:carbonyl reductase 1
VTAKPHAVVSGGNRGLGHETCRQLAERGYRVTLTARDLEAARAAAAELGTEAAQLDVTDPASIAAFAAADDGPIDLLINNAAVALDGFDAEIVRRTLDTNVRGPMRLCDAVRDRLSDGAQVVMVSSGMGELAIFSDDLRARFSDPELTVDELDKILDEFVAAVERGDHAQRGWPTSAYSVSKAALGALTRIYARDYPKQRWNAVCPGWVRTDMGGRLASRSVAEGAASIIATAILSVDGPTGVFMRDGVEIDW